MFFEMYSLGREDDKWDFKKELNISKKEEFYEFIKDLLAFTNSGGGYLILGIENQTNEIVGISNKIDEADLGQRIEATLGYSIDVKVLYFEHEIGGKVIQLGLIYIKGSEKIRVSSKDFTSQKGEIIQSNIIYVRRNTRSIRANGEELERLMSQIIRKEDYKFKESDVKIIERNKSFIHLHHRLSDFLKDKYEFTALNFADKLQQVYFHQTRYNKLEFATLIGFETDKIDDYFDGRVLPKLEHILRANVLFDLPIDFFFKPSYWNLRTTVWKDPVINYCIVNKLTNKVELFRYKDEGKFFYEVFVELGKALNTFREWINSEYKPHKDSDELIFISPKYDFLDKAVSKLPTEKVEWFKKFLSTQHYKTLELAGAVERKFKDNGFLPYEEILDTLLGYNEEFICRIINESISEITIKNDNVEVKFHFFEEVLELIARGREYNTSLVLLELNEAKHIIEE